MLLIAPLVHAELVLRALGAIDSHPPLSEFRFLQRKELLELEHRNRRRAINPPRPHHQLHHLECVQDSTSPVALPQPPPEAQAQAQAQAQSQRQPASNAVPIAKLPPKQTTRGAVDEYLHLIGQGKWPARRAFLSMRVTDALLVSCRASHLGAFADGRCGEESCCRAGLAALSVFRAPCMSCALSANPSLVASPLTTMSLPQIQLLQEAHNFERSSVLLVWPTFPRRILILWLLEQHVARAGSRVATALLASDEAVADLLSCNRSIQHECNSSLIGRPMLELLPLSPQPAPQATYCAFVGRLGSTQELLSRWYCAETRAQLAPMDFSSST
mgnify:CR=1 FL=1